MFDDYDDEYYDEYGNYRENDAAGAAGMILMILLIPFLPVARLGIFIGESISDINGVRYSLALLLVVLWTYVLYKLYEKYEAWGVLGALVVEGIVVDAYYAFSIDRQMFILKYIGLFYDWFFSKI
jgi:hypothetical protein